MKIVPEKETKQAKGTAKLMETVIGTFALALVREGVDYESLPLEGKGVLYAITKGAEGILKKHISAMNETLKATMEQHDGRVYEGDLVKVTLDTPEPQTVESVDAEAVLKMLQEGEGMALEEAEEALEGIVQKRVSYSTDATAIRDAVDRGILDRAFLGLIESRVSQGTPRLFVTAKGDLKKRLGELKKRALPSGR